MICITAWEGLGVFVHGFVFGFGFGAMLLWLRWKVNIIKWLKGEHTCKKCKEIWYGQYFGSEDIICPGCWGR